MEKVFTVLEIVLPIFVTIFLGIYARKKNKVTEEQNKGLQQFIMTFCVPCVLFNSCLTCNMGMESITSMGLVFPIVLLSSLWSFKNRKKKYPYHNLPMLFSAKETGMAKYLEESHKRGFSVILLLLSSFFCSFCFTSSSLA